MATKADNENIIKRVYCGIKEQIISYNYPPGERLSIELLADQLRVSTTPVREILNRLAAEDLVVMVPKMGFFMKGLSDSEIRDLYELNQLLLVWSVENIKNSNRGVGLKYSGDPLREKKQSVSIEAFPREAVKFTHCFFKHLAIQSRNDEVVVRIRNINDRLHLVRLREFDMIADSAEQVLHLCDLYNQHRYDDLTVAIKEYFEYRLMRVTELCKALRASFSQVEEYMDDEYGT